MVDTNQLKQRHISGNGHDVTTAGSTPPPLIVSSPSRDEGSNNNKKHSSSGCFSGRNVMILLFGAMLGYMVIPIVLVETSMMVFNDGTGSYFDAPKNHLRNLKEEQIVGERLKNLMENQYILSHQSLPTDRAPHVMETPTLSDHRRKKILVTGGAGFVGSHLVDKLMMEGHEVTVLDNLFTGQKKNIAHWFQHPNFK
jgi:hypothetical protein